MLLWWMILLLSECHQDRAALVIALRKLRVDRGFHNLIPGTTSKGSTRGDVGAPTRWERSTGVINQLAKSQRSGALIKCLEPAVERFSPREKGEWGKPDHMAMIKCSICPTSPEHRRHFDSSSKGCPRVFRAGVSNSHMKSFVDIGWITKHI